MSRCSSERTSPTKILARSKRDAGDGSAPRTGPMTGQRSVWKRASTLELFEYTENEPDRPTGFRYARRVGRGRRIVPRRRVPMAKDARDADADELLLAAPGQIDGNGMSARSSITLWATSISHRKNRVRKEGHTKLCSPQLLAGRDAEAADVGSGRAADGRKGVEGFLVVHWEGVNKVVARLGLETYSRK
jgi:hypothetical protein